MSIHSYKILKGRNRWYVLNISLSLPCCGLRATEFFGFAGTDENDTSFDANTQDQDAELTSLSEEEEGVDQSFDNGMEGGAESDVWEFVQNRIAEVGKRRRLRVEPTSPGAIAMALSRRERRYWLKIDDKIMLKTHLELLNTSIANTGTSN